MASESQVKADLAKPVDGNASDIDTTGTPKSSQDVAAGDAAKEPEPPAKKSNTMKIVLVTISIQLTMFLVALDRTIISTAIPEITDEFKSLTDVGWYGSSYLLTCCALQLLFGKLYTFFAVRTVLFFSVLLFEIASAICGAAPNSVSFIIGRAIAGIGAAGIFAGAITSILHVVPLAKRPVVYGFLGALMSIAQITGPLIGGGFTSHVSWRWCFYINLPIGGLAMTAIYLFLRVPDEDTMQLPLKKKMVQLDAPGTALVVPGVVALLLALQWGGQLYPWGEKRIIALLVVAAILLIAFIATQIMLPATATLPPRLFKNRTVVSALALFACMSSSNFVVIYFLPIWFQAITGVNAAESGIRTIPLMLSTVVGTIIGGFSTKKIGYYTQWAIIGSALSTVGAGLLITLEVDTSKAKWIGYQVVYGFGYGLCYQIPNLAIQTVLPKRDAPTGFALCLFGGLLAASVFLAVGENVLANQLVQRLDGVPGFDRSHVTAGGVLSLLDSLPEDLREKGLIAYNEALRKVFQVGLIVTALSVIGGFTLEWKSVNEEEEKKKKAADAEAAEAAVFDKKAGESDKDAAAAKAADSEKEVADAKTKE